MPRKTAAPVDDAQQITKTRAARPSRARAPAAPEATEIELAPQRSSPRPPREAPRAPARESTRQAGLGAAVMSRDGEVLARRRAVHGDPHYVPLNEIPTGWDYQWNLVTVANEEFIQEQNTMFANGWRPVPADRHPGRWTSPNHKGAIIVKGLRLEERPSQLGDEARAEDIAHAKAQVRDQTDVLKLSKKLPAGMAVNPNHYKGTGGEVRMTIDQGLDIPRPEHQVEE